jgi:hypothetical protein
MIVKWYSYGIPSNAPTNVANLGKSFALDCGWLSKTHAFLSETAVTDLLLHTFSFLV